MVLWVIEQQSYVRVGYVKGRFRDINGLSAATVRVCTT